ncbi:retrotransposon gag domain, retroviral aspartyl protease [Tanacetum coccineum]
MKLTTGRLINGSSCGGIEFGHKRFGLEAKDRCHDDGLFGDIIAEFRCPSRWEELSKESGSKILPCGDGSCWKTFKLVASLIALLLLKSVCLVTLVMVCVGNLVLELLISWSNRPVEKATWESYDLLKEQFPNFRLEDKSFYQEGSNDTTGLQVNTRKRKRVKTYDPDLNELDQFIAIFGIWLDPLGSGKRMDCGSGGGKVYTYQDMEHHVLHLEQTLKLLHDIHFFVKLSKCCFGQTKVLFLGHVVTSEGVQVEQEKLSAVKSWSIHSNVKQEAHTTSARFGKDIAMDLMGVLTPSNRFDMILVVVDHLSKYAHFVCLSHPFTAKSVASVFCKEIVRLHGFPRSIVSDRDPYRQRSLAKRRYEKLSPQFFGPYRVKRVVGLVSYELQLPSDVRIHPVFHVLMLKPAYGSFDDTTINPLPVTKDWEADLQPDSIISHIWVSEAGNLVLELLISWSNRPVEEATWESYDLLKEQFPNFRLEDKSGANDPIATQLATIAAKLEAMESLKEDIADLKRQAANKQRSGGSGSRYEEVESSHSNHNRRPFHKIEFPVFSGGDPRG